jgi:hypothetical protein
MNSKRRAAPLIDKFCRKTFGHLLTTLLNKFFEEKLAFVSNSAVDFIQAFCHFLVWATPS